MTGMMMIFGLTPNIQAMVKARVVGKSIFDVIDRVPEIIDHDKCVSTFEVTDSITFENVTFKYPTAPENTKNVLENINFKIKAG
jgi:ABC-type multidrug transport system fused ATPase/permease subunit